MAAILILKIFQLQEMKTTLRSRDQRVVELQVEADQLREQAARQNSIISSLKKRIQVNKNTLCIFTKQSFNC